MKINGQSCRLSMENLGLQKQAHLDTTKADFNTLAHTILPFSFQEAKLN